jgi:hypothetical protein
MRVHANAQVEITFHLTLTEAEAAAIGRISGYAPNAILAAIKQTCGDSAINEHDKGFRAFFGSFNSQVGPALEAVRRARLDLRKAEEERLAEKGGV